MIQRLFIICLLCVFGTADLVQAQPPGRFGGRRGGPGRGAFGEGLAFLATMPDVQVEISLSPKQAELIFALQADLRDQIRGVFAEIASGGSRGTTPGRNGANPAFLRERMSEFSQVREKITRINGTGEKLVAAVLKSDQFERVSQIQLQLEGIRALERPSFATKLGLTDEQTASIRRLHEAEARLEDAEDNPAAYDARRKKLEADIRAELTASQLARWDELKGKPFRFSERRRGRRGRRPGNNP